MECPYCHHALRPLIVSGRPTGAFQCDHCTGTWLQYQAFRGLLPGAPGLPGTEVIRIDGMASSSRVSRRTHHGGRTYRSESSKKGNRFRRVLGGRWAGKRAASPASESSSDWDICTYCGKPRPGNGPTCIHCNVERMTCPVCGRYMVGVRKHGVLVDICLSCRGLWFEKGRLEQLVERLSAPADGLPAGPSRRPPSLWHQIASFLEETEPAQYGLTGKDPSVASSLSSAFSAGLTGGRRILYDVLVLLGDLQSPPETRDRTSRSGDA